MARRNAGRPAAVPHEARDGELARRNGEQRPAEHEVQELRSVEAGAAVQREEWDGGPGRRNAGPVAVQHEEEVLRRHEEQEPLDE